MPHGNVIDDLAISASLVLWKYGSQNPDWREWRELKDSLLKIHHSLSPDGQEIVGRRCSDFQETLRNSLEKP